MVFIPLPDHDDPSADRSDDHAMARIHVCCNECARIHLAARRRVQVVNDKLRCVQMLCPHADMSSGGAPTVLVRTLDHAVARGNWRFEDERHRLSFADLWADQSYEDTGLAKLEPVFAVIHPYNPFILYFVLHCHVFAVDMSSKRVVGCEKHKIFEPDDVVAALSLLVCRYLPPARSFSRQAPLPLPPEVELIISPPLIHLSPNWPICFHV